MIFTPRERSSYSISMATIVFVKILCISIAYKFQVIGVREKTRSQLYVLIIQHTLNVEGRIDQKLIEVDVRHVELNWPCERECRSVCGIET
jgi:hypothetical protein